MAMMLRTAKQVMKAVTLLKLPKNGDHQPGHQWPEAGNDAGRAGGEPDRGRSNMGGKQLRQIDRKAGERAEHEIAKDRQHDRVVRLVAVEPEIQREPGGDGADRIQRDGRPAPDDVGDEAETDITGDAAEAPDHDAMADERHRGDAINTALLHHQRQDRRQPDVGGPDRQQRTKAEQQADDRAAAVLRGEELHRHEAHELAIVIGDALSRPDRLAPFGDGGEPVRFDHAPADDREQQRRYDADEEHHAPAVAADQSIGPGAEERAERAACHHEAGDLGAMRLAQRLGEQWNADHQFRACAEAGDETVERQNPRFRATGPATP